MRILLDNNVKHGLARIIVGHEVVHARTMGWAERYNGDLISAAEISGFDAIITADKQMRYQQNLTDRKITILVLSNLLITWKQVAPLALQVQAALDSGLPQGSFLLVGPPPQPPGSL